MPLDKVIEDACDSAHPARPGEVGLGQEPDRLVDPKVGTETGQIMQPGQEMRQKSESETPGPGDELSGKRGHCGRGRTAVQHTLDPSRNGETSVSFGPADEVVGIASV